MYSFNYFWLNDLFSVYKAEHTKKLYLESFIKYAKPPAIFVLVCFVLFSFVFYFCYEDHVQTCNDYEAHWTALFLFLNVNSTSRFFVCSKCYLRSHGRGIISSFGNFKMIMVHSRVSARDDTVAEILRWKLTCSF